MDSVSDDQRQVGFRQLDIVGGLKNGLDAGAAHALHQVCRHLDGDAGVERDVPRQHISVKRGLRHVPGDHYVYVGRRHTASPEDLSSRLDPEIGGRHQSKSRVVFHERSAHAVEQENIVVARKQGFVARTHSDALVSRISWPATHQARQGRSFSRASGDCRFLWVGRPSQAFAGAP